MKLQSQTNAVTTAGSTPVAVRPLQRKCACGQHTGGRQCDGCRKKKEAALGRGAALQHTAAVNHEPVGEVPPIVYDVLRSPGEPLDVATRAFFEPRFGHDFSRVRIHADARAAESAHAVNALAYTVGPNIVFGSAQYGLETWHGRALLSHELTHVVQQSRSEGEFHNARAISYASSEQEREAERAAIGVLDRSQEGGEQGWARKHPLAPAAHAELARQSDDTVPSGEAASASTDDPRKLECGELGCPYKARCGGKLCEVVDCGRGSCPNCPPEFANLIISAWCSYRCYPSGSAFYLISRIGNFPIGPFCLD